MKRLVCRWVEYYLALCEDDIETGLPAWVRRHLQSCARCQAEADAIAARVRRYADMPNCYPTRPWKAGNRCRFVQRGSGGSSRCRWHWLLSQWRQ
jgi:hypothetical protein